VYGAARARGQGRRCSNAPSLLYLSREGRLEEEGEEEVSAPPPPKKRRVERDGKSQEPENEQEERKRRSRQRRSALASPKTVDEVINEWIRDKGSAWSPRLRTDLEGRLLTHDINLTIDVVEGMLKQRLSELNDI
jgi:hypothetical protein